MGQEIGVSPVQLISLVSTIANDGVFVPPRIIAGTTPPRSTPQLIAFHPALGRRVISPMTAAQMKNMMEGVVLRGTGKKAILDGYTSAGKTGTSQKVDPSTGRYSHRQHVASFGGFAPINNPAVSVLVVLDAPATYPRDQGGDVAAPVFARVAQQVLAYMNVPHDVDLQDPRRLQLRAKANTADMNESAPDHIGEEAEAASPTQNVTAESQPQKPVDIVPSKAPSQAAEATASPAPASTSVPAKGTVVLDVVGGVEVPDFRGKPLRAALEQAESAGIELQVSGSGVGQEQSPVAGSRIPPGGHVMVKFGR
jgi:cell division protein FtsI (penicillin-binding protein 3)